MNFRSILRNLFWNNTLLNDRQKELIYEKLKKNSNNDIIVSNDDLHDFINQVLDVQKLDNSFSINYPQESIVQLSENDPKLLAYYLPQYCPNPYNDKWWGKGSTEWTTVSKSMPQYVGHYQPRLPGELGFYDLRILDNILRQIELAKIYGIYGFCFYYYWFNGTRLLDEPFDLFVNSNEIDFPFSICWVNESWTKQWTTQSREILMENSLDVDVNKRFIFDVSKYFESSNYITVDGKFLLNVYEPTSIPDTRNVLEYWREYILKKYSKELYIVATLRRSGDYDIDFEALGYDASSEFALGPHWDRMNIITNTKKFVCDGFYGKVFDYQDFVVNKKYLNTKKFKLYRALCPMWDNTARRRNKGFIADGSTPCLYKQWLKDLIIETAADKRLDDRFIYINAWNEWGEGAYLEPDLYWKYGYLEATAEAILETRREKV